MKRVPLALVAALFATAVTGAAAQAPVSPDSLPAAHIAIDAGRVLNTISPDMYGSCIEDVNHEIYGGLYDQKIFGESFEEPPPAAPIAGWTAYGGDWRGAPDGASCQVSASSGAKLVRTAAGDPAGGAAFADGVVEAEVRFSNLSGDNAGLLIRVARSGVGADNFDGYEISLRPAGQVVLGKHRHNWQPLATEPARVNAGDWNRLRVVLSGPRLRVYVNDAPAPAIDYTDAQNPLPGGTIALRTWNSDAAFRNVRVQPAADTPTSAAALPFVALPVAAVSGMWDAVHSGTAPARFALASDHPFNGSRYQRIEHGAGAGRVGVANRGLNRWSIAVARGQKFAGRVYLRSTALAGPVTVALQSADGARTYATQSIAVSVGVSWRRHPFTLTANASDPNARFALWLDRPGTLDIDQAVLMGTGAEQFHGLPVRADIASAIVRGGIRFLRYGGTMVNAPGYRWKKMIGDPDRRPPYRGHWYPYSTNGFGIFDFLRFCEAAHIESAFAINSEETAQDAADLADYLTAPVSAPWGRRRAADGHPSPYRVRYIEIGNEEVIGDGRDAAGYAHYADRFRALVTAIHGRNPALKLVCAAWWVPDSPSMKPVFEAVDGAAAAWDLHVDSDDPDAGRAIDARLTDMQARFRRWNPQTALQCVVFEENGNRHDQARALGHATTLNATRRHGDFVLADCPANCLQPNGQNDNGWDQGQIFFTPDHVWPMPPGDAQKMAAQAALPLRVESTVAAASTSDAANRPAALPDILATRSADGKTLALSVVNTGASPLTATIAISHFGEGRGKVSSWTLAAPLDAVNAADAAPRVRPQFRTSVSREFPLQQTFPAHSYTILRFENK